MKRDMDLVRNILLRLEGSEKVRNGSDILKDLGEDNTVRGHLDMMEDAGFVEQKTGHPNPNGFTIHMGWRMTWVGYEFLDSVRDPEIWRKTKAGADRLGSWTIKLLAELATGYVRAKAKELGLPI